jgi:hypothetical protein
MGNLIFFFYLILCGSSILVIVHGELVALDQEKRVSNGVYYYYATQYSTATSANIFQRSLLDIPQGLPLGLKHQTKEEADYLKLHKCQDEGEAYSASYLITKKHLLQTFTNFSLQNVK